MINTGNYLRVSQPTQNFRGNDVSNSTDPAEGAKAYSFTFDFTAQTVYQVDLTIDLQAGRISGIQTCYVDNSQNNQEIVIVVAGTGQTLRVAAGAEQYVAVLSAQPCKFSFTSTGSNDTAVFVALLNTPMPFASWFPGAVSSSGTVVVTGTVAVTSDDVTWVDRSGSITAGGTSQVLAATNATRGGMWVQNNSTAALGLSELGAAALTQPSLQLLPGAYYEMPSNGVSIAQVQIIGGTTGQAFSAREWNK